jgi:hypothetical protein
MLTLLMSTKPDQEITDSSPNSPVTPSVSVSRAQVLDAIARLEKTGELDLEVPNSGVSNAALDGPHTSICPPSPNETTRGNPCLEPEQYTLQELKDWMNETPVFAVDDDEPMPGWMVEALEGLGVFDAPHDEEQG